MTNKIQLLLDQMRISIEELEKRDLKAIHSLKQSLAAKERILEKLDTLEGLLKDNKIRSLLK
jgi:hypothetical protein